MYLEVGVIIADIRATFHLLSAFLHTSGFTSERRCLQFRRNCSSPLLNHQTFKMGITRDSRHKRAASGARRAHYRKKRKFELGRQPAMTKLDSSKRIHEVRTRGGNTKYRALRLDSGNFAWGSEAVTRKTRLIQVRYNATNNELLRTQTLVKGAVVDIDATPFRQWYESHYAQPAFRGAKSTDTDADKKQSNHVKRILEERKKTAKLDPLLEQQFKAGRLLAVISSRPGQSGRADGYILEGKELEFYHHKLQLRKAKHAA
ncbi:ribosomal protein S8.e [Cryptococcus depauperatus]